MAPSRFRRSDRSAALRFVRRQLAIPQNAARRSRSRKPDPRTWTDAYLVRVANALDRERREGRLPTLQAARGHPRRQIVERAGAHGVRRIEYAGEHPRNRTVSIGSGLVARAYRRAYDAARWLIGIIEAYGDRADWYVSAHGVPLPTYGDFDAETDKEIAELQGEYGPKWRQHRRRVWRVVDGSLRRTVDENADRISADYLRERASAVFEPGSVDAWEVVWREGG